MPHEFSNQDRWYAENLEPHEGMLRAWLGSRFSSDLDLDDIIQEAYLRVFKAHQVKEIKAPKAFLFATARNIALNMLRESMRKLQINLFNRNEYQSQLDPMPCSKKPRYIFCP